jgi:hypothetical protein
MSRLSGDEQKHSNGHSAAPYTAEHEMSRVDAIQKIRTAGSVSMDAQLFEKLYLSPKNHVKGDLRSIVGNPTPL